MTSFTEPGHRCCEMRTTCEKLLGSIRFIGTCTCHVLITFPLFCSVYINREYSFTTPVGGPVTLAVQLWSPPHWELLRRFAALTHLSTISSFYTFLFSLMFLTLYISLLLPVILGVLAPVINFACLQKITCVLPWQFLSWKQFPW